MRVGERDGDGLHSISRARAVRSKRRPAYSATSNASLGVR